MKNLWNKKKSIIISMVILAMLTTLNSITFAKETESTEIENISIVDDTSYSLNNVTPNSPFIYQGQFIFNTMTPYTVFEGDNVSISSVATDSNGNAVTGATIHVELVEEGTGNVVASLNVAADGYADVATGTITSGKRYRFTCLSDKLHMDTTFSIRLVAVVY